MAIKSWLILIACFLFTQSFAQADTVYTTVFNVIKSKKTESLLILSGADGRVYKTHNNEANAERMNSLKGKIVRLDYQNSAEGSVITNIQLANPRDLDRNADLNHFEYNQLRVFAPTDIQTEEAAAKVFKSMINDGDKNRSQCFKRAHIWSYDMWANLGITSQKVFMFYTRRYIEISEFKWWFHVAPVVTAGGVEYVMDGTFMNKPVTIKDWLKFFMQTDKITCPEVNTYQEFENNQWNRLCYHMKTSMYHFRPFDIEARDKKGEERNHWVIDEVQDARRAFKKWQDLYEGLDSGNKPIKY